MRAPKTFQFRWTRAIEEDTNGQCTQLTMVDKSCLALTLVGLTSSSSLERDADSIRQRNPPSNTGYGFANLCAGRPEHGCAGARLAAPFCFSSVMPIHYSFLVCGPASPELLLHHPQTLTHEFQRHGDSRKPKAGSKADITPQ